MKVGLLDHFCVTLSYKGGCTLFQVVNNIEETQVYDNELSFQYFGMIYTVAVLQYTMLSSNTSLMYSFTVPSK